MAKILIGAGLVVLGVGLILVGLYETYAMFTAKKPFPQIFQTPNIEGLLQETTNQPANVQGQLQQQLQQIIRQEIAKVLPADFLVKTLNLSAWLGFMAILIYGAGKIAGLGIKFLAIKEKEK